MSKNRPRARLLLENSYWSMRARCTMKTHPAFGVYGGAGITICVEWMAPKGAGLARFCADMGPRPEGKTLDRKPGARIYSKGNCRWATHSEQSNNMKNNVVLRFRGVRRTASDWARHVGMKRATLFKRLRLGWSVGRALSTVLNTSKRNRFAVTNKKIAEERAYE